MFLEVKELSRPRSGTYLNIEVAPPWEPDRFDDPQTSGTRSYTSYLVETFAWLDNRPQERRAVLATERKGMRHERRGLSDASHR